MKNDLTSSKTMKELVEKADANLIPLKQGDTVEVEVISVGRNRINVNVKDFCTGIIPEKEFSTETIDMKPGDKILAYLIDLENEEGFAVLSLKRADKERVWQDLKDKLEKNESIKVRVSEFNRGGLIVQYGSLEGFLPISQISSNHYSQFSSDQTQIARVLKDLINQVLEVKVINIDPINNKLIFSEKEVTQMQQKEKVKKMYKVGQRVKCKITGIAPFGLFVNLGDAEGLVHISKISWERVTDLHRMFKIGEDIEAEIVSIENGKISLSMKQLTPDPWLKSVKKYEVDQKVEGLVTKITPFGAFVELDDKITGLLHISELANSKEDKKVSRLEDILEVGKKYSFKINKIEADAHKISLSLAEVKKEKVNSKKKTKEEKSPKK